MNLAVAVLFVRCQKITESQMPQDAIETVSIAPRVPQDNFELILTVISTVIILFDFSSDVVKYTEITCPQSTLHSLYR